MEGVPCVPNEECKYAPDCHESVHHLVYPRRKYRSSVERQYRDLPENKVVMCRAEHDELHATEQPPKKPPYQAMAEAIRQSRGRDGR